jgi:hypothetical protein
MKQVKTTCNKCKTEITLDFTGLSYEEAIRQVERLDNLPKECPGFHVEIGGWRKRWNMDEALRQAYPEQYKN